MKVLVDTPVWSAALRRPGNRTDTLRQAIEGPVSHGLVAIIGPIRQEILSGIRERSKFEQVRDGLRHFPDLVLQMEDYETAAEYFNLCRARGVQGSMTDYLICAVAVRRELQIFTTDGDFKHYRNHLPIALYAGFAP